MRRLIEQYCDRKGPERNPNEVIPPDVLRALCYNFDTLSTKIAASPFMCPELQKLLDQCSYLRKATNEERVFQE